MSYEPRIPLPDDVVVDGVPSLPAVVAHYLPDVAAARQRFNDALAAGEVPARTKELVRLHNAKTVDCAYCRNVRYSAGGGALVTEQEVVDLQDVASAELPEPVRVALQLAQAFSVSPGDVPAELVESLREHYSASEVAELVMHLARVRAGSKTLVTLGLEPRAMPVTVI